MEFIGFLVIILLLAGWFIMIYNNLIALREKRKQAFSDVDVQLKQRYDLIPQLVETVKGYMSHEKEVLENVTAARTGVKNSGDSVAERAKAESALSGAMMNLFAVAEAYPDLKANENFQHLMDELSDIEDKIAAARRFFNSATQKLNVAAQQFPAVIVANMFGFTTEDFFEVEPAMAKAMAEPPEVKFGS
ncbi:MAG: LemA family protein [Alphaproteobacteria bacterium]|nr:LemA family protein [Alphaproteobacteria bacterium]